MKSSLLTAAIVLLGQMVVAQVGIGTTNPNPASILDVVSSDKGLLIPRISLSDVSLTSLDAINSIPEGMLIYNENPAVIGGSGKGVYLFNGVIWERLVPKSAIDDDWVDVGVDIERQAGDVYIGNTNATNNNLYVSNQIIDWDNPNYILDPGSFNKVNEIEFDDGSPGDPSIRFDDATTGFFSPGTDILGYSINSTERLRIDASGRVGISTTAPGAKLDVRGSFSLGVNGNIHQGLRSLYHDFGSISIPNSSSVVLSFIGTTTTLGVPNTAFVNVSFIEDLGQEIILQATWMESDSVNFRLYNKAATTQMVNVAANFMFLWN